MTTAKITPDVLSSLDQAAFTARLGHIVEHSPWVAERAWAAQPFASVDALHMAMMQALRVAGPEATLAVLRAHPELARPGALSADSTAEQNGAGLSSLDADAVAAFAEANQAYRARFGFPFIIAVRGQRDAVAILQRMRERLLNTPEAEHEIALREVAKIARFRLDDLVGAADDFLTVHVLDTATGRPAVGLGLELSRDGHRLGGHRTNKDGRCAAPLLAGDAFSPGVYELVFDIDAWRGEPGFYDRIAIRFRVPPSPGHLHIPLLLSPFGYSTYRGS